MPRTTLKHEDFVKSPMHGQPVTAVPGIGPVLGVRLSRQGFHEASGLLGQFLQMRRDTAKFAGWVKDVSGANARQAESCSQGLKEWCDNNL